jgi:hypothetical protein
MNHFTLFAHGEAFDVDAFLATTTLSPDFVWRRGDQRRYACVESRHPTSGVEIVLGDGLSVPYWKQEEIAISYLKEHRDPLLALAQFPGAEVFILGIQYVVETDPATVGFCVEPSAPLVLHARDIGARLNYYVTLDRRREWEREDSEPDTTADQPTE